MAGTRNDRIYKENVQKGKNDDAVGHVLHEIGAPAASIFSTKESEIREAGYRYGWEHRHDNSKSEETPSHQELPSSKKSHSANDWGDWGDYSESSRPESSGNGFWITIFAIILLVLCLVKLGEENIEKQRRTNKERYQIFTPPSIYHTTPRVAQITENPKADLASDVRRDSLTKSETDTSKISLKLAEKPDWTRSRRVAQQQRQSISEGIKSILGY